MTLRFCLVNSEHPATEIELISIENRIGCRYPDDYRGFLQQTNGGQPAPAVVFHVADIDSDVMMGNFLDTSSGDSSICSWLDEVEEDLSGEFVPIGFDPGGNMILLGITDRCSGVYYWDSARAFPTSSDDKNVFLIASSFTEFVDSLTPLEQNE